MKLFFTETHIINLTMITHIDIRRGQVYLNDGKVVLLTAQENNSIQSVLKNLYYKTY